MGSMHTGLEEPSLFSRGGLKEMAEFYSERAKGQAGLIVTGGIAPNNAGRGFFGGAKMSTQVESDHHKIVTQAVHDSGGHIAMQILHTGRYGYHFWNVSSSAIKAPIGWFKPHALSSSEVLQTIDDFVKCAVFAKQAGYDGVEVMGSEGYLINQFLVQRTNKRTDEWGGSYENRMKFPTEIVKKIRQQVGNDFIIIYRLSMLDLVEGGSSWAEIVELAQRIEAAGASVINTGIGWHEARIPTIATRVPRGGFAWVTKKMKSEVSIPLCTTNRINSPQIAEDILSGGYADMVSMARPFLADPEFMRKASEGRENEINTCIGCNQACLDHIFVGKRASCLVNPRAAHELDLIPTATKIKKRIAVVGGGPAGLSCAVTAAQRGHSVTLFEKDCQLGGQFNMAKLIPGKEEFYETIRYFQNQIKLAGVELKLNTNADLDTLKDYDSVVLATGVVPRQIRLPNNSNGKVQILSYVDVLRDGAKVGDRVAIIGAGGIGFDVADFLTHSGSHDNKELDQKLDSSAIQSFLEEWGVDSKLSIPGGLSTQSQTHPSKRKVYLMQRKPGKLGSGLGKTTGWIHRTTMKKRGVEELSGCSYLEVTEEGLVIDQVSKPNGPKTRKIIPVDTVIICAGQESFRSLLEPLKKSSQTAFLIGGSQEAGELDAKRAIDQGTRLACQIETATTGQVFSAPSEWQPVMMEKIQSLLTK